MASLSLPKHLSPENDRVTPVTESVITVRRPDVLSECLSPTKVQPDYMRETCPSVGHALG
jgi:hypothetical protein